MEKCQAVNAQGKPCQAPARADDHLCFWHSKHTKKAREAARVKGGIHRRRKPARVKPKKIEQVSDILALVNDEIVELSTSDAGAKKSQTVGYLARLALDCLTEDATARRLDEMERAIEAIREEG